MFRAFAAPKPLRRRRRLVRGNIASAASQSEVPEGRYESSPGQAKRRPGQRSNEYPPLSTVRRATLWAGAADRGKRELLVWAGYPGRQSLRSFALGYFLLAPPGWQLEPPDVGW